MTEMLTEVGELIHLEHVISLKQTSEQQAQQSLIRRALLLNLDRIATKITEYSHGHPTIRTRQALTEFSTFMGPKLGLTGSLDLTKHVIPNQLEIIYNILKGAYKIELLAKPIKRQRLYQNDLVRMTPERIPDLNLLVQELIVTFDAEQS